MYTQGEKDLVRTQQDGGHLQVKEKGLRRNQPYQHLDLDLPATNCEKNKIKFSDHLWSIRPTNTLVLSLSAFYPLLLPHLS